MLTWSGSEAVLPAYLVGMVLANCGEGSRAHPTAATHKQR